MDSSPSLSSSALEAVSKLSPETREISESFQLKKAVSSLKSSLNLSKQAIRSSLRASTWDGVFAAIFSSITGGVLLSNFLLQLGASTVEIGIISSVPMLVNLLQPVGAYLASRTTSRYWYGLAIFGTGRLLWLILVVGICFGGTSNANRHNLLFSTLGIVLATYVLTSLGGASWLSWMAILVPQKLRGRYFGFRNSAASLTTLICVPLFGFAVSAWPGGTIQGYGVFLLPGILCGLISLGCQFLITDVNPQVQNRQLEENRLAEELASKDEGVNSGETEGENTGLPSSVVNNHLYKQNFGRFLLYFGFWTFAINVSNPFLNIYLLDDLAIDVSWVTLYTSLAAGANLLMLVFWGKIADRIGNRPLLLLVGIVVAVTPLFWLGTANNPFCLWVWLPILHLLNGGTFAAIDLCNNNIQMSVAPIRYQASYFAIAAAVAGVAGALATIAGGFLAQFANVGGLPGLFALSSVLRLIALLPLVLVREQRSQPILHLMQSVKQTFVSKLVT